MKIILFFLILSTLIIILINTWNTHNLNKLKNNLVGEWDELFLDIKDNKLSYFQQHAYIEGYAIQVLYDCKVLENGQKVVIGSVDEAFFNIGKIKLLCGRLPRKNNEIAIEKNYLSILGVNKVGDTISHNSILPSLNGFKVCGVIENYSMRWNMFLNEKFINCFVSNQKNTKNKEYQVFVKAPKIVLNDLEVNFLEYKKNINIKLCVIKYIVKLWTIGIILILVIFFSLRRKYISIINLDNIYDKPRLRASKKNSILMYLFLNFARNALIINLINKIIVNVNFFSMKLFLNNGNNIMVENNMIKWQGGDYFNVEKVIKVFPFRMYESFIEFIIIAFLLCLLSYYLLIFFKKINYKEFKEGLNRKLLKHFYFGTNYFFEKKILYKFFIELLINNLFLCTVISFYLLYSDGTKKIIIFTVLVALLINVIIYIMEYFALYPIICLRKKESNILLNEWRN